jgi:NADH-quinone oxidoreductase subunit I
MANLQNESLGGWLLGIREGIQTTFTGLSLTWKHLWAARQHMAPRAVEDLDYFKQTEGIFTLDYPNFNIEVPEVGRYQLHNEIDDCIVCDKCVKICPVDCIEIDVIKSAEAIGVTSDGTTKRLYAERFDIDMSKCCFCGLCTTVCPTDCLTMTGEIDVATTSLADLTYAFSNLTPEEAQVKKDLYQTYLAEKAAIAATKTAEVSEKPKPAKPWAKPVSEQVPEVEKPGTEQSPVTSTAKPLKPWAKPAGEQVPEAEKPSTEQSPVTSTAKPLKPWAKPAGEQVPEVEKPSAESSATTKTAKPIKPWAKPVSEQVPEVEKPSTEQSPVTSTAKPLKPWQKPVGEQVPEEEKPSTESSATTKSAKPLKPWQKPPPKDDNPTTE